MNATNDRPSLQVLERTFTILESFDEDRPEWSATEIARALDLPIPTVHRLLTALKHRGYVSQHEGTKRFRLGVAALQLGDRARAVVDLRGVAMPALRRLAQDTVETALLTVLTPGRDRGMCLERVETPQPLRLSVTPGRQLPLHAGASQKVLLAYLPDEDVERVIAAGLEHLCHARSPTRSSCATSSRRSVDAGGPPATRSHAEIEKLHPGLVAPRSFLGRHGVQEFLLEPAAGHNLPPRAVAKPRVRTR